MFMRNRLARKMAAEMRGATCAGTQTSKAPTLSGPSVTNHYSVPKVNGDWSIQQEVDQLFRKSQNFQIFYQMNWFMLANELIQHSRNTSIATAVKKRQRWSH